jgi:hypothetical protein
MQFENDQSSQLRTSTGRLSPKFRSWLITCLKYVLFASPIGSEHFTCVSKNSFARNCRSFLQLFRLFIHLQRLCRNFDLGVPRGARWAASSCASLVRPAKRHKPRLVTVSFQLPPSLAPDLSLFLRFLYLHVRTIREDNAWAILRIL